MTKKGNISGKKRKRNASFYQLLGRKLKPHELQTLKQLEPCGWDTNIIAQRRGKTQRRINQILSELEKKGIIHRKKMEIFLGGGGSGGLHPKNRKDLRLHGICLTVDILKKNRKYLKKLNLNSIYNVDNATVMCHEEKLTIYIKESFSGKTSDQAMGEALPFIIQLLSIIERKFDILLLKNNVTRMRMVKCHYGKVDDEFAKKVNYAGLKFSVKNKQGRQFVVVDASHNQHELEAIEPSTANEYIQFWKDLHFDFYKHKILPSDHAKRIQKLELENKALADLIRHFIDNSEQTIVPVETKVTHKPDYVG